MQLNDLLLKEEVPPKEVMVMRHRPTEPELRKVLPWLAADRPEIFNAYQQTQTKTAEQALVKSKYLASFIGHEPGKAVFVGLYKVGKCRPLSLCEYQAIPAYAELKLWGHVGFQGLRPEILWFDLDQLDFHSAWKGKLIVRCPPPERSWWRWADRNEIFIDAILDESQFASAIPEWDELSLRWDELKILPTKLQDKLREWRGIYLIFDVGSSKAYVGSAYGHENILGRWLNYSRDGHGGNKLLRQSRPSDLRFSILQRVSPDLEPDKVIKLENSWKNRLLTREFGLNQN